MDNNLGIYYRFYRLMKKFNSLKIVKENVDNALLFNTTKFFQLSGVHSFTNYILRLLQIVVK